MGGGGGGGAGAEAWLGVWGEGGERGVFFLCVYE